MVRVMRVDNGSRVGRWMRMIVLSFIIYHSSFSPAGAQTPQQWRDSVSTLNEAIRQNPRDVRLRLLKAEANINLQQWEYARDEFSDVLRLDDRNLAALYFRAFCHVQLKHFDMAKADYQDFLAISPRHFEANMGLAHVYQKMGRKSDAQDQLNLIVQLFPDSADAYAARAAYETEQKQYDVALYDWDEALRLRPQHLDFIVSKVNVLLKQNKRKEARDVLDETVRRGTPKGALKEWYDQCR